MEDKKIRVYHTHIEVSPYTQGENPKIERYLSIWLESEHCYDPYGYYIEDDVLYLPRGYNVYVLEKEFESSAFYVRRADKSEHIKEQIHMLGKPRDRIQEESINFLSCKKNFKKVGKYSQQALILDTGDGKTFTTVYSILQYRLRAIIITHQEKIKKQWIETFKKYTDIDEDKLINIGNSNDMLRVIKGKKEGYMYFINHQTINSCARLHGWNTVREFFKETGAGIKVFDEAHLSFKNVLRVDMFSNTEKTFYLTANFGRSDIKEQMLFKKCFASVYKFGEETRDYEEKRKQIIYVPVLYRSNATFSDINMATNVYGFSVLKFSEYALHRDEDKTMIRHFYHVFDIAAKLEGKILITVPKIDDTEFIKECIKKEYPDLEKSVSTINSKNTKEENSLAKDSDIICSTIKSCGTGVDIKGLRCIINMEPFNSSITANQLSGRLREYAKDKDTYFFDMIDISFPSCERQYQSKLEFLRKKCKEIKVMRL